MIAQPAPGTNFQAVFLSNGEGESVTVYDAPMKVTRRDVSNAPIFVVCAVSLVLGKLGSEFRPRRCIVCPLKCFAVYQYFIQVSCTTWWYVAKKGTFRYSGSCCCCCRCSCCCYCFRFCCCGCVCSHHNLVRGHKKTGYNYAVKKGLF